MAYSPGGAHAISLQAEVQWCFISLLRCIGSFKVAVHYYVNKATNITLYAGSLAYPRHCLQVDCGKLDCLQVD